ncbi:MAG: hypothetical protein GXO19_03720 [Epsilonproteobacteria bacterium]|nr:hypothetical protein [Campylobacterota bacterium]NPA56828.1 hypothetical protein [Campylobacterota bacterium]
MIAPAKLDRGSLYLVLVMLLAILAIYLVADFVIMEDFDRYVEAKRRYDQQKRLQRAVMENNQNVRMRFAALKRYEPYLMMMKRRYDNRELEDILKGFFDLISLDQMELRNDGKVMQSRYVVWVRMESPRSLFDFLHTIREHRYPFEIVLPLEMKKVGDKIEANFELDLYTLQ